MKKQTLGSMIAALRKEKGLTQLELAQQLGITDKAVSKWERDLACPDVGSLPKLAQILDVSVDELMQGKTKASDSVQEEPRHLVQLICRAVALAMGVAVVVLSLLKQLDLQSGFGMLGVGLVCLSILQFMQKDAQE